MSKYDQTIKVVLGKENGNANDWDMVGKMHRYIIRMENKQNEVFHFLKFLGDRGLRNWPEYEKHITKNETENRLWGKFLSNVGPGFPPQDYEKQKIEKIKEFEEVKEVEKFEEVGKQIGDIERIINFLKKFNNFLKKFNKKSFWSGLGVKKWIKKIMK